MTASFVALFILYGKSVDVCLLVWEKTDDMTFNIIMQLFERRKAWRAHTRYDELNAHAHSQRVVVSLFCFSLYFTVNLSTGRFSNGCMVVSSSRRDQ